MSKIRHIRQNRPTKTLYMITGLCGIQGNVSPACLFARTIAGLGKTKAMLKNAVTASRSFTYSPAAFAC
jgi:uroporphyrinogen-III decarboxylase